MIWPRWFHQSINHPFTEHFIAADKVCCNISHQKLTVLQQHLNYVDHPHFVPSAIHLSAEEEVIDLSWRWACAAVTARLLCWWSDAGDCLTHCQFWLQMVFWLFSVGDVWKSAVSSGMRMHTKAYHTTYWYSANLLAFDLMLLPTWIMFLVAFEDNVLTW